VEKNATAANPTASQVLNAYLQSGQSPENTR
jgi:hypothetical protein